MALHKDVNQAQDVNQINAQEAEPADKDLTPNNVNVIHENGTEKDCNTLASDALDVLDPLSGSDMVDGLEPTNLDNQIEFSHDVDMETLMTALHIEDESHNKHPSKTKPKPKLTIGKKPSHNNMNSLPKQPTERPSSSRSSSTTPAAMPRGQIKIRDVTLKRHKESSRNYYCALCNDNIPYKGVQALNNHHQATHNPVQCRVCSKWCSTPENLRCHSYTHYDKKFKCDTCGESFNFNSELKSHLIVHDTRDGIHQCMKSDCGKRYMRKSELAAHVKTHSGKKWPCPQPGCTFEALD